MFSTCLLIPPDNHVLAVPRSDRNYTGCDDHGINCYPLKWKTIYDFYEEAGVSWQLFQDTNNFDDNPLAWFEQFQTAPKNSPLAKKGMSSIPSIRLPPTAHCPRLASSLAHPSCLNIHHICQRMEPGSRRRSSMPSLVARSITRRF